MADWDWKLRLFASADLVGSTAYKQSTADNSSKWAGTFREFFRGFPTAVENGYLNLPEKCPPCSEPLVPWKFSGDEILFCAKLSASREVVSHIAAFKHAVSNFPSAWQNKGIPLKLKGTAWIAGFPVINTEIEVKTGEPASLDFIGPSIDLGFRIARFADVRRFVLSADLALMALDAIDSTEVTAESFRIHFHGREPLKGVIGNEPYPIIWLDMRDGKPTIEETLLGISREPNHQALKEYLRRFIDETPQLIRPFIDGDRDHKYGQISQGLVDLRDAMKAEETDRGYLLPSTDEPASGEKKTFPEPKLPHPPA